MDTEALDVALGYPAFSHVSPQCFGPPMWKSLHNIFRAYEPTPEKEQALKQFMSNLATLFPCPRCGAHIKEAIKTMPTDSKYSAFKWSIDFHNSVNERINKPILSYKDAIAEIVKCTPSVATPPDWKTPCYIFITLFVLALVAIFILSILLYKDKKSKSTNSSEI